MGEGCDCFLGRGKGICPRTFIEGQFVLILCLSRVGFHSDQVKITFSRGHMTYQEGKMRVRQPRGRVCGRGLAAKMIFLWSGIWIDNLSWTQFAWILASIGTWSGGAVWYKGVVLLYMGHTWVSQWLWHLAFPCRVHALHFQVRWRVCRHLHSPQLPAGELYRRKTVSNVWAWNLTLLYAWF